MDIGEKPYPQFRIQQEYLSIFTQSYIEQLTNVFGIDEEIDLEALEGSHRTDLYDYLVYNANKFLDADDKKYLDLIVSAEIGQRKSFRDVFVPLFISIYCKGMRKWKNKKEKEIFEFFS